MKVNYPSQPTRLPQSEAYALLVSNLEQNNNIYLRTDKGLPKCTQGQAVILDFNPDLNNLTQKTKVEFDLYDQGEKVTYTTNAQFCDVGVVSRRTCRKLVCVLTDTYYLLEAVKVYTDRIEAPKKRPRQKDLVVEEEDPVIVTDDVDLTSEYQLEAVRQLVNHPNIQKVAVRKVVLDLKPSNVDLLARESSQQYKSFLKGLAAYSFSEEDNREVLLEVVEKIMKEDPTFAVRIGNLSDRMRLQRFSLPGPK